MRRQASVKKNLPQDPHTRWLMLFPVSRQAYSVANCG
jgi:hypothetical protein